jgi:DNA-directed RNA polymerase subunit E'/Rpb7
MANILVNPYIMCEMTKRVPLYPYQMDVNLYKHLKNNLIKSVERKCNNIGYVVKVYKITDYTTGIIEAENLSGNAVYDIRYIANVCKPIEKMQIIVRIDMRTNDNAVNLKAIKAIKAVNGPIDCVILSNFIDNDNFVINGDGTITCNSAERHLQNNDHVKVTIQSLSINSGMDKIVMIGFLNDIATEDEVNMYFKVPSSQEMAEEHAAPNTQIQTFE